MTIQVQVGALQPEKLRKAWQKCSLGCPILDRALNGGIPCGSLTELAGESSAAKTQLCLQLLLAAQLPVAEGGLEGSALYIYTENYFASSRLQQLASAQSTAARERRRSLFASKPTPHTAGPLDGTNGTAARRNESVRACFEQVRLQDGYSDSFDAFEHPAKVPTIDVVERTWSSSNPCKNIYVQGLTTAEELVGYLDYAETLLTHPLRMPVRVLVIDSIAALFQADFHNNRAGRLDRGLLFFQIASRLKQLAEKYDLAVVVTNHVTDYFEPVEARRRDRGAAPTTVDAVLMTSGRRVTPALGISWAQCVNVRLFLSRENGDRSTISRSLRVVFAPHIPDVSCCFLVDADGVQGLPVDRRRRVEGGHDDEEQPDYHYSVDVAAARHFAVAPAYAPNDDFEMDHASDVIAREVAAVGGFGYVTP